MIESGVSADGAATPDVPTPAAAVVPPIRMLALSIAAFLAIFALYSLPSTVLAPRILGALGDTAAAPRFVLKPIDLQITLYWSAFTVAAIALSLGAVTVSVLALRRYLRERWRTISAALLAAATAAMLLNIRTDPVMVELPRRLTCASAPQIRAERPFLCDYLPNRDRAAVASAAPLGHMPEASAPAPPADWIDAILGLKWILNIAFQAAAIFLLGAMIALAALGRAQPSPAAYYGVLIRDSAIPRLFLTGGLVLSAVTLTDVIFASWPIAAAGAAAQGGRNAMTGMMTAAIFFYAVLGSLTLGATVVLARMLAQRPLSLLPPDDDPELGRVAANARLLLRNETVWKIVIALSPVLTTAIGSPLVADVVKAIGTGS